MGIDLTGFKFHSSELCLPGKATVILDCINRSNMFWVREGNSSLLHADQTSILGTPSTLGKVKIFRER